jgi:hypothetical protein
MSNRNDRFPVDTHVLFLYAHPRLKVIERVM